MESHDERAERSHPDLLRLDAVRAGDGTPEEEHHLGRCRHCRELLHTLRATEASLRRAVPPAETVPPGIDRAVLEAFRQTMAPPRKAVLFPPRPRWLVPAIGTAAAAALVLVLAGPLLRRSPSPDTVAPLEEVARTRVEKGPPLAKGDINGDGTVDILDALRLARLLESGKGGPDHADLDGDGRVTSTDVNAVARRAVAL